MISSVHPIDPRRPGSGTSGDPASAPSSKADPLIERTWTVLSTVMDPEVPVVSVVDLGVVREVRRRGDAIELVLTTTYSGCPATEVIEQSVRAALGAAGIELACLQYRLAPAWSSAWISEEGRRRLREYGIAPPGPVEPLGQGVRTIRFQSRRSTTVICPRCASLETERLSAFGSTACKALYRCRQCREPFEYFKPI